MKVRTDKVRRRYSFTDANAKAAAKEAIKASKEYIRVLRDDE